MTTAARMPQLTEGVVFRNHEGLPNAAFVTGTRESIKAGGNGNGVPAITRPDELHLAVYAPDGSIKVRHNIRQGDGAGQWEPLRFPPYQR